MKEAIIIFVRNPELGKVKTRLASDIGDKKALEVYIKLLEHTRDTISGLAADKFVFSTETFNGNWPDCINEIQSAGDLGTKMYNAFELVFARGYDRILIIGSDCLELTEHHMEEAFTALNNNDIVIGPATDGGYYLLGMKKCRAFLFSNKTWSTPLVYQQTLDAITQNSLSVHSLIMLKDVDTVDDMPAQLKKFIRHGNTSG